MARVATIHDVTTDVAFGGETDKANGVVTMSLVNDAQEWQVVLGADDNLTIENVTSSTTPVKISTAALTNALNVQPSGIGTGSGDTPAAQIQVVAPTASTIGLLLKAASSQTANMMEVKDNAGARKIVIDSSFQVAIGAATPASTLDVTGSVALTSTLVTASTHNAGDEFTILCDCTANGIAVTLPAITGNENRIYNIKKIDATENAVTISTTGSGVTIDGSATEVIGLQNVCRTVHAGPSHWYII